MSDHEYEAGHAQVMAASRIAEALVVGFDNCAGEGRALTQLQQSDMLQAALIAFDGYRGELRSHLEMDETLRRIVPRLFDQERAGA